MQQTFKNEDALEQARDDARRAYRQEAFNFDAAPISANWMRLEAAMSDHQNLQRNARKEYDDQDNETGRYFTLR